MFSFKQKLGLTIIDHVCPIGERALKLAETEEGYV